MPKAPINFEQDEFNSALRSEDELGMVLRAHIYIEESLNTFLELMLASPKHLEKMNLEYSQRVSLAIALGLKKEYESPLLTLGRLRNQFAHRTGMSLSKQRVNVLFDSFSNDDKQLTQESYEKVRKKIQTQVNSVPFSKLEPKQRFVFIAITLRSVILIAKRQLENEPKNENNLSNLQR